MVEQRKGTRCAVCTGCGRCFTDEEPSQKGWSGKRCEVCVSCGECAKAWGIVPQDGADAVSGPTSWADAFKVMDTGFAGTPPPVTGAPGQPTEGDPATSSVPAPANGSAEKADAVTGATPGVSAACAELGLNDMEAVIRDRGIKPPGVA